MIWWQPWVVSILRLQPSKDKSFDLEAAQPLQPLTDLSVRGLQSHKETYIPCIWVKYKKLKFGGNVSCVQLIGKIMSL